MNGLAETCLQLGNFPTGLLASFLAQTTEELDAEMLGETIGLTLLLALRIGEVDNPLLGRAGTDFATRFGKGLTSSLAEGAVEDESASDLLLGKLLPALGTMASKLGSRRAAKAQRSTRWSRASPKASGPWLPRTPSLCDRSLPRWSKQDDWFSPRLKRQGRLGDGRVGVSRDRE